jgi:segregation and condensation protein B
MTVPPQNLEPALEALLFSSDQPLTLSLLAEALDTEPPGLIEALTTLGASYAARGSGVELREIAGGWQFVTAPEQADWVGRMLRGKRRMRLSRAALETMAIIAYKQPVTKSEVEAIRGVDSSGVLATLLERDLVTIRGRSKVVGRPLLYGTTHTFLEYFGLRELSELPRPEELRALVAAREPEQLDMMEIEVVSQVATDLAANEAFEGARRVHDIEFDEDAADAGAEDDADRALPAVAESDRS